MESAKCHFGSTAEKPGKKKDKSQRHNKLPINNNKTYRSAGGRREKLGKLLFQLLIITK